MVELFYIIDAGDALAQGPLSRVFTPTAAMAVGHVISWAVNGALWLGLMAVAAHIVA